MDKLTSFFSYSTNRSTNEIKNKALALVPKVSNSICAVEILKNMACGRSDLNINEKKFTNFYSIPAEKRGKMDGDFLQKMIIANFEGLPEQYQTFTSYKLQIISFGKDNQPESTFILNVYPDTSFINITDGIPKDLNFPARKQINEEVAEIEKEIGKNK